MSKFLIGVQFNLYGMVKKENGVYVAICPVMDVASQGETIRAAKQNLEEACKLFLESCIRRGTLDRALEELGFRPAESKSKKIPTGAFSFPVELPYQYMRSA